MLSSQITLNLWAYMKRSKESEKILLRRCLEGDSEAWRDFVSQYSPLIYYVIQKVLRSKCPEITHTEINDLHNDIFLSLMEKNGRKLRQYKGKNGCSVPTWIRVIAVRSTIDHLRKKKDMVSLSDDEPRYAAEKKTDPTETPVQLLESREERELLKELIDDLAPKDRLFIRLFYYDEVPPAEIAKILKTTPNAVYSRGNYLREKLRDALKKKLSKKQNL